MRPSKPTAFMRVARVMSELSTCVRRKVGCVLVDGYGHVIGIGFNGVPRGVEHCSEGNPCPGARSPSGTNLDACLATHAEANALLQCRDVMSIETVYCTTAPCIQCVKLLMNTSAAKIVFAEAYPGEDAKRLWESIAYRFWVHDPGLEYRLPKSPPEYCQCPVENGFDQPDKGNCLLCGGKIA